MSHIPCCCWFYFDARFCLLGRLLEDRNAWDVCPVVAWSYVSLVLIDEMWCVGTSGVYSYARLFSSTIFYLCNCYCFSYFDLTSNSMFTFKHTIYIYILHYRNKGKTIFKFKLSEKINFSSTIFNFMPNLNCSLSSEFSSLLYKLIYNV